MSAFKDKMYCASPNCQNECGRKMNDEERHAFAYLEEQYVSYGFFCGDEPREAKIDEHAQLVTWISEI